MLTGQTSVPCQAGETVSERQVDSPCVSMPVGFLGREHQDSDGGQHRPGRLQL